MNLPIAPIAAALLAVAAVLGVVLIPTSLLEAMVMDSGLPALVHAAEPPLGMTARLILAVVCGGIAGLVGWFLAFIVVGTQAVSVDAAVPMDDQLTPNVRRADAHPDAPPRPPLRATRDLGMPFPEAKTEEEVALPSEHGTSAELLLTDEAPAPVALEDEAETVVADLAVYDDKDTSLTPEPVVAAPVSEQVPEEQDLPEDLDQPLAAFDPAAILPVPLAAPEGVVPLRPTARPATFDTSERFETYELKSPTPIHLPAVPRPEAFAHIESRVPASQVETGETIHALLERLERGVIRRGLATGMERSAPAEAARNPERGLEEALVTLRNLAKRA